MSRILLVEDDEGLLALIKFSLEKLGHQIFCASNGREALALMGLEDQAPSGPLPDLIITDIMMPVMDGYTFQSRLQQDESTRRVPLIVLTAKGSVCELFQQGAAACFQKPIEIQALREHVARLLPARPGN